MSLPPVKSTRMEWPRDLQLAYDLQEKIGWTQVQLGLLSKQWELIKLGGGGDTPGHSSLRWTGYIIQMGWKYGLDMWKVRNELVHGKEGNLSRLEKSKLRLLVQGIYR